MCMCVSLWVCVCLCVHLSKCRLCRGQRRALDPLELEFDSVTEWGLATDVGSSAGVCDLTC